MKKEKLYLFYDAFDFLLLMGCENKKKRWQIKHLKKIRKQRIAKDKRMLKQKK